MRLLNKKVIVTGANRSIGKAIAIAFAKEGADVAISYRSDESGATEAIKQIHQKGRKAQAFYADFSTISGCNKFFEQAVSFLGGLDILVNNAAAYNTKSFLDLPMQDLEHLLMVSVRAPMALSQLAAKHMINAGVHGSILNVSAITGSRPHPGRSAHATAKAALNMATKSMALELAKYKIRVNAIEPGSTPYENTDDLEFGPDSPLGRQGLANDHAKGALYLVSDEADWVTGHILRIDGGESL